MCVGVVAGGDGGPGSGAERDELGPDLMESFISLIKVKEMDFGTLRLKR